MSCYMNLALHHIRYRYYIRFLQHMIPLSRCYHRILHRRCYIIVYGKLLPLSRLFDHNTLHLRLRLRSRTLFDPSDKVGCIAHLVVVGVLGSLLLHHCLDDNLPQVPNRMYIVGMQLHHQYLIGLDLHYKQHHSLSYHMLYYHHCIIIYGRFRTLNQLLDRNNLYQSLLLQRNQ